MTDFKHSPLLFFSSMKRSMSKHCYNSAWAVDTAKSLVQNWGLHNADYDKII